MAEGGAYTPPAKKIKSNNKDVFLADPSVLTSKLTTLVEELEVETVMVGMKSVLPYAEVNAINAEPNRSDKICKLIEYIKRRLPNKRNNTFNTFMKIVAGVQPDLFTTLAGRAPSRSEADFCVENYVRATKEQIQASGHITDSVLDQKIDLDSEHVELAIVSEQETEVSDSLPHKYKSHLSDIAIGQKNIPASEVLNDKEGKKNHKRVSLQGRAGTGKTTTMQWFARQWSSNKWAAEFTMIFLVQLRMLSLSDFPMTAIELLTAYSLYRVTEEDLITLGSSWIRASAAKLLLLVDGLDEIGGFTSRLNNSQKITDPNVKANPIDICINIIRGDLLPGCTVLCASRPFTGLSAIKFDQRLEILGLTEARVEEFVKIKHPSRSGHIMSVLKESPLLMSVCSITFYCALISQLLADGVIFENEDLQTYTRLIAFLMVQCVSRRLTEFPFIVEVHPYFPKVASMAYRGIIERHLTGDISKLVFDEYDIVRSQLSSQELRSLQKFGVLQIKSVKTHLRPSIIAEFLHFSMQELLASANLLSHPFKSDGILRKLFSGGQFNMALLYVFGLQYDTGSSWVKDIRFAVDPSQQGFNQVTDTQISNFLEFLCQDCKKGGNFATELQICQLVHESQMEDKAKSVARYIAPIGKLFMAHTHLTIIDLMAVRFVCKYADSISQISIASCSLTGTLTRFLASSLLKDHDRTLHILELCNCSVGDNGAHAIADWFKQNQTLRTLNFNGNVIGDDGAKGLAEALQQSNTLQTLDIGRNRISDDGTKALAEALRHNRTLQTLHVEGNHIGDSGATALAEALQQNKTVQTLNVFRNTIGDNGATAFAEALCHNSTLQTLSVSRNKIGENGTKALAGVKKHNKAVLIN